MDVTRAEVCAAACADSWRDAGEVLASPFGLIPALGARLARLTTRTLEDAEDALQDAMLSAHRGAGAFRHDAAVGSWFHVPSWYAILLLPSFLIYLVTMVGETNRIPFDLPEGEGDAD